MPWLVYQREPLTRTLHDLPEDDLEPRTGVPTDFGLHAVKKEGRQTLKDPTSSLHIHKVRLASRNLKIRTLSLHFLTVPEALEKVSNTLV